MTTLSPTRCPKCSGHLYRDQDDDTACWTCGWRQVKDMPLPHPQDVLKLSPHPLMTLDQERLGEYVRRFPGLACSQIAIEFGVTPSAMKGRLDTLRVKNHLIPRGRGGLQDVQRWYVRGEGQ